MYKAIQYRGNAEVWDVVWQKFEGDMHITTYETKAKAEVCANFLNLLDMVDDDDFEQLDEINGWMGW